MYLQIARLVIIAFMIATVVSVMIGSTVFTEQPSKAQNMTTNMTDSIGNMTEDGSISSKPRGGVK